jgi:Mn-dependent DtxR family transcriptional regulator
MNATERIARRKRVVERLLRRLGLSRAQARRVVSRFARVASMVVLGAAAVGIR